MADKFTEGNLDIADLELNTVDDYKDPFTSITSYLMPRTFLVTSVIFSRYFCIIGLPSIPFSCSSIFCISSN